MFWDGSSKLNISSLTFISPTIKSSPSQHLTWWDRLSNGIIGCTPSSSLLQEKFCSKLSFNSVLLPWWTMKSNSITSSSTWLATLSTLSIYPRASLNWATLISLLFSLCPMKRYTKKNLYLLKSQTLHEVMGMAKLVEDKCKMTKLPTARLLFIKSTPYLTPP